MFICTVNNYKPVLISSKSQRRSSTGKFQNLARVTVEMSLFITSKLAFSVLWCIIGIRVSQSKLHVMVKKSLNITINAGPRINVESASPSLK